MKLHGCLENMNFEWLFAVPDAQSFCCVCVPVINFFAVSLEPIFEEITLHLRPSRVYSMDEALHALSAVYLAGM